MSVVAIECLSLLRSDPTMLVNRILWIKTSFLYISHIPSKFFSKIWQPIQRVVPVLSLITGRLMIAHLGPAFNSWLNSLFRCLLFDFLWQMGALENMPTDMSSCCKDKMLPAKKLWKERLQWKELGKIEIS